MKKRISEKIKSIEKRLNEIRDLEKHIGNYGETKKIEYASLKSEKNRMYSEYKKS